jgi:uncharacterized UBP type Zn finger protein
MSTTLATPSAPTSQISLQPCVACHEVADREEMSQCLTCFAFMCGKHTCSCPIDFTE